MDVATAQAIVGGPLGRASKLNCKCWNLPAKACHQGGIYRRLGEQDIQTHGTTPYICGHCYARKGRFVFHAVERRHFHNLACLYNDGWCDAMATLILAFSPRYFRWHSSGDLQSLAHLRNIVAVCKLTPDTLHWMPTQEHALVRQPAQLYGPRPSNLKLRRSSPFINYSLPHTPGELYHAVTDHPVPNICTAKQRGGHCGDCIRCFTDETEIVLPIH